MNQVRQGWCKGRGKHRPRPANARWRALACLSVLVACSSHAQATLIAHFTLDETSGPAIDRSGNGYPTTVGIDGTGMAYGLGSVTAGDHGAITISPAQAAQFGTAIDFGQGPINKGNFNIVDAGADAVHGLLSPGTDGRHVDGSLTIMAWVRLDATPSLYQSVFTSGDGRGGWRFGTFESKLVFTTAGSEGILHEAGLVAEQWFHMAAAVQDDSVSFYLDGRWLGTRAFSVDYTDETGERGKLGGWRLGQENMRGRMDEVKIFDTALDASAIAQAALPMSPVPEPGTAWMALAGICGLGGWTRLRRRPPQASSVEASA